MNNKIGSFDREKLIEMGVIIESEEIEPDESIDPNSLPSDEDGEEIDSFPNANYDLQNEIIRFFSNNPGADPELFRQFSVSIGIEPDELQLQMNILFSQFLKLYLNDAEELGYGSALVDDEVPDEIRQMVSSQE